MAARDVVVLNEQASRLEVAQTGDSYNMPADVSVQGNVSATGNATVNGSLNADKVSVGSGTATQTGEVNAQSITLNGVNRVTWPTPGSGSQALTDVLNNGPVGNIPAGSKFTLKNSTGTVEHLSVDGDTGAFDLAAIAQSKAHNVVAWFYYDTSKDSDGGAWRKRCQHTSWYNETLNTATRGATREFPAQALIVAESNKVTIYDLTQPTVPMWMVFNANSVDYQTNASFVSTGQVYSVAMLNGVLVVGGNLGCIAINFLTEEQINRRPDVGNQRHKLSGQLIYRNDNSGQYRIGGPSIAHQNVNSVAMTILDDAPIDSATGLPIPTIDVFTGAGGNGGLSIINSDGTVTNITNQVYGSGYHYGTTRLRSGYGVSQGQVDFTRIGIYKDNTHKFFIGDTTVPGSYTINHPGVNVYPTACGDVIAVRSNGGLQLVRPNFATPANSMHTVITSAYNTGWMVGSIQGCWLANDPTVDRSVARATLTQVGTLGTDTTLDITTYLGGPNYCEIVGNRPSLAGDFCFMIWAKVNAGASAQPFLHTYVGGTTGFVCQSDGTGKTAIIPSAGAGITGTVDVRDGRYHLLVFLRRNGNFEVYVDGVPVATPVANNTDFTATANAWQLLNGAGATHAALARFSLTAPTAEQIKYIYETERKLFETNAKALLSANNIKHLDYYEDADILGVKTASAYDYLHGLEVIHRGLALTDTSDLGFTRAQYDASNIYISAPAKSLRDELARKDEQLARMQNTVVLYHTTAASPTDYYLPQGLKPLTMVSTAGTPVDLDTVLKFDGFRYYIAAADLAGSTKYIITARRV